MLFTIERSTDGVQYKPVGTVAASAQDCQHPFQYTDVELTAGVYYYRLKMDEAGQEAGYSKIVQLTRGGDLQLALTVAPNPVVGNTAVLRTSSPAAQKLELMVHDMAGRKVMQQSIEVTAGIGTIALPVGSLSRGTYVLQYQDRGQLMAVRFVKQ